MSQVGSRVPLDATIHVGLRSQTGRLQRMGKYDFAFRYSAGCIGSVLHSKETVIRRPMRGSSPCAWGASKMRSFLHFAG